MVYIDTFSLSNYSIYRVVFRFYRQMYLKLLTSKRHYVILQIEVIYIMAIVGYARVSTVEQNEERQIKTLQEAGAEKIYIDKLSGKNTDRPQLKAMQDYVREGDTLIISEYSRLARSTKDLLDIVEDLDEKGVKVISQKENLDTSTPQGRLMLTIFSGIAQFEREIMLQRQAEGIAIAKEQGKYKGRAKKDKPNNWNELYSKYKIRELKAKELIELCGVSKALVYKWIEEEKKKDC